MIVHSLYTLGDTLCTFLSTFHNTDIVVDPQTSCINSEAFLSSVSVAEKNQTVDYSVGEVKRGRKFRQDLFALQP